MRGMFSALMATAACICMPALAHAQEFVSDPYEDFNRQMFGVHESVDKAVLEPVARGYRAVTPSPVRSGVRNFLNNLHSPAIFANDLLQGEVRRAGVTAARFGVNSTIGVLGVFDPARSMGLERHDEDFGQTLAVWGAPSGPYLWIPLMGPTTVRDGFGSIVDIAFDPLAWARFDDKGAVVAAKVVVDGVSTREALLDGIDDVRRNSLDPYVTFRTTYGLLRYSAIQNGRTDVQQLPDFEPMPGEAPSGDGPAPQTEFEQPQSAPQAPAPADTPSIALTQPGAHQ
ncbi:MAG TPA: VacJ family lipoprotein [Caulobacterales bacterium]|nr:VacJ family lipoprotein [Caulobacterales bacterium]